MKNPNENPILQELREIRERMFEEAGGSLETLVKQLQERQRETIEKRKVTKDKEVEPVCPTQLVTGNVVRTSKRSTPDISRKGS